MRRKVMVQLISYLIFAALLGLFGMLLFREAANGNWTPIFLSPIAPLVVFFLGRKARHRRD